METCKKHPKYLGKIRPRVNCEACWSYYIHQQAILAVKTEIVKNPGALKVASGLRK